MEKDLRPSTYFYSFYQPRAVPGSRPKSILDEVLLQTVNTRKTLMQTLCSGSQNHNENFTPDDDLRNFRTPLRRLHSTARTFCTGWHQFRVLAFQRLCLEKELDPAFMKVQQVARKAMRSHDRNEDELSFAKTVAAVAPFGDHL